MKTCNFILILTTIKIFSNGSPLESLPPNSPATFLLKEYCSSFTNTSLNDVTPFVEFINLLPNTELQFEVDNLKRNEERGHVLSKSAFGLLSVLFPELQPQENKTLALTELKSQDCCLCYGSKVEHFYEGCGFGVCKRCLKKVGAHCPYCRIWHRFTYKVALYQLDNSHYPFVAVLPSPEKPDLNESIKKVYSSLVVWTRIINNMDQPFSDQEGPNSKLSVDQTKATIKILQIFDILQHRSLWEFKEPLLILRLSVIMLRKMLFNIDPNRAKKSFVFNIEAQDFETLKQAFAEMKISFLELFYYIQWLINTFIRQCHHVSNQLVNNETDHFAMIGNFVTEFRI